MKLAMLLTEIKTDLLIELDCKTFENINFDENTETIEIIFESSSFLDELALIKYANEKGLIFNKSVKDIDYEDGDPSVTKYMDIYYFKLFKKIIKYVYVLDPMGKGVTIIEWNTNQIDEEDLEDYLIKNNHINSSSNWLTSKHLKIDIKTL